jgi:hypothetical protein
VYPTKEKAQEAKEQVMSEHECYGRGYICVGGTWEDEIDLVIRETLLYLEYKIPARGDTRMLTDTRFRVHMS